MSFKEEQENGIRMQLKIAPWTAGFIVLLGPLLILFVAYLLNVFIEGIGLWVILYLTWVKLIKMELANIQEGR